MDSSLLRSLVLKIATPLAIALALLAPLCTAQSFDPAALRVEEAALRAFTRLTPDQWNAVKRGEVQAKVLDTQEKREVAVVGATRVHSSATCFATRFQDIEAFKKNPAVLKIRKLQRPVNPQDFDELTLEPRDLADLPNCRVGNCKLKLSKEMIESLHNEVDWTRPDHDAEAQSWFREQLLEYVEAFLQRGNSALTVYADKEKPVSLEHEFFQVLDAQPGLGALVPEFRDYLAHYPSQPLPGVTGFLYWSDESFGLKPTISVTHVSLYIQPGRVVTASKQIYAAHYFEASLGIAAVLEDRADPSNPGMYLVYLNRSRIDLLGGFFGGLRRMVLRSRLREGMRKNLAEVARKLETSCAESSGVPPQAQ
jgi:hypothetical protein